MAKLLLSIIVLAISPLSALAWTAPTQAPTNGNSAPPLSVSSTGQTKLGPLILNSTAASVNGLLIAGGNVGIGTTSPSSVFVIASSTSGKPYFVVTNTGMIGVGTSAPASRLSVQGSLQVGNDASACNAGTAGMLKWNAGLHLCIGTMWKLLTQ